MDVIRVRMDIGSMMAVTFKGPVYNMFCLAPNWFKDLQEILPKVKPQVCMSVFKTYIGGWTTTHRMNEPVKLSCFFGCQEAQDEMLHYIWCTPLWLLVAEEFGCSDRKSVV